MGLGWALVNMANWKERALIYLMEEKGYDIFTAGKIYARAYKRIGKSISQDFNREFETYASLAYNNNFVKFDIKSNRLYIRKTGETLNSDTFAKAYTVNRLSNFASKYSEVNYDLQRYIEGEISLEELNRNIEEFKRTNAEYLKEGS